MAEQARDGMALGDTRVLDLADEKGAYCTKILADMGADVIKLEPPGGDTTRRNGPFWHDMPEADKSLYFWQYNTNKRSITLNIDTADGREILKRLLATADVLVETCAPGYLDRLGLSYGALKELNPALIMTSITSFGQTGPYKDYKASDIVGLAMGGMMACCGLPDTPPLMPYGGQAYHTASSLAAIATLIALYSREYTGKGQHIDVPMQACVAFSLEFMNLWYIYNKVRLKRQGSRHGVFGPGGPPLGSSQPCRDGWMCIFGSVPPLEWMEEEGMVADLKSDERLWTDILYRRQKEPHVYEVVSNFVQKHGREELFHRNQKQYHVSWAPIYRVEDVFADSQMKVRGFFVEVEHPELGTTVKYPGAPYRHEGTPWRIVRRPPLVGEHNLEVLGEELGYSREQLALLASAGVI